MFSKKAIGLYLILVLIILAACSPADNEPAAAPEATATTPIGEPTTEAATPTPEAVQVGAEAIAAAMDNLSEILDVEESEITLDSITDMEWPDACLGLAEADEMCAQVITPGYLIVLEIDGEVYEVRTDREGRTVRIQQTADPTQELPAAIVQAQQTIADELNVEPFDLNVVSFERREWTDSCLGLGGPAESCLQVITPGWLIMVEVGGQTVEVRTDETGDVVRVASRSRMGEAASGAAIVLNRSGGIDGAVTEWRIYADGRVQRVTGLEAVDGEASIEEAQVEPQQVEALLNNLEESGFFDLEQSYVPGDTCCDRYFYNLSVNAPDRVHAVSAVEATEDVPESVWESIDLIQQFVETHLTQS
ncbi:MAG TPA: hypothetical protein VK879_01415 [Candidatus Sulfomarinibacteraceae bacterium]|nr:hypothetical protein [Candidatus Sulfomarinibacteraceae bacterium]